MMYTGDKTDPVLGKKVVEHLHKIGMLKSEQLEQRSIEEKIELLKPKFAEILDILGMNMEDENLVETPKRLAKMWARELLWGMDYKTFPKITTISSENIGYDSFVLEKSVTAQSCCSHHFMPMYHTKACTDGSTVVGGGCVVAYIPKDKVLGLSKLNRVVEWAGMRAQTQEQYTKMIVEILKFVLETDDVACWTSLNHGCIQFRGQGDKSSQTTCLNLLGKFETDSQIRSEFLAIARKDC